MEPEQIRRARSRFPTRRRQPIWQWTALLIVFLTALAYQVRLTADILRGERVDVPLLIPETASAHVQFASRGAQAAGLHPGDTLLAINGAPYTGTALLGSSAGAAKPGDRIIIRAMSSNPVDGEKTVSLPVVAGGSGPLKITIDILLNIFMPLFCLLLGCWVALVRPRDPASWLLLGILLGFSHLLENHNIEGWARGWRELGTAYHVTLALSWPVFMFLFGWFFPEPFPSWKKAGPLGRAIPWIVIAPLLAVCVVAAFISVGELTNYASVQSIYRAYDPFQIPLHIYTYFVVGAFFGFIFTKSANAESADNRRRLSLLYWGLTIAMTPALLITIGAALLGKSPGDILPDWLISLAIFMLLFAPLTFGYVIVVQRAMDVRVALRLGLQYGLATRGIRILQFVILGAFILVGIAVARGKAFAGPRGVALIALGVIIVSVVSLYVRRAGDWIRSSVDRRFFREAYDTENVLSELGDQVRSMVETRLLIETVAARIGSTLHVPRVAVMLANGGPYLPALTFGYASPPDVSFPAGSGTARVLETQNEPARVYLDDPDSWLYRDPAVSELDRSQLAQLDSELLLPLSARDKLLGFISLGPKLSEEPYSGTDVRLLKSVAAQTGLALENARLMSAIAEEVAQRERLNREVEIAREVQERLFPQKLPPILGIDYAGACRPALGVGGDYYDFLALPDGQLGIAIGDVSGKGIAAALMMASLQASLRGEATRAPDDLAAMIGNVNRLVFEASQSNRYATFFYAQYDPASRQLKYVNAGHNPPMLFHHSTGGCQVNRLDATGTVVGLLEIAPYEQGSLLIAPGDVFVAFTDGISEAMNQSDEEWGENRLQTAVEACHGLSPSETIARLMQAADTFVAGAKQHDDMTLVVLRSHSL